MSITIQTVAISGEVIYPTNVFTWRHSCRTRFAATASEFGSRRFSGIQFLGFLAGRDPHDLDGRADHVGGRFLPRGPRGISASVAAGAGARRAVDRRFDLCDNLVSRHSPEAALVSFAEIFGHAISAVLGVLIVRVDVVIPALAAFYDCAGLLQ